MNTFSQCVGIDISKATFVACFCGKTDGKTTFSDVRTFKNDKTGFNQLLRWTGKQGLKGQPVCFLMEATGVYYENLAYHLRGIGKTVHVVLPNTSKHFAASLNTKTKTDEADAKVLARFGTERTHREWTPPEPIFLQIRNLTRYYVQLKEQKTALNNILHSKEASHEVQAFILTSNKQVIAQIDKQIEACKREIEKLVRQHKEVSEKIDKVLTIKGLGFMTVATIIAETYGFEHFRNAKQVVSYAGYDVVERQSGSSVKGKTRISKKGNRYIRNALYFPGMVACRFNEDLKNIYVRIIQKKPSKMVGQVAVQRKLLVLIYTLWKNDTEYIPGYAEKKKKESSLTQKDKTTQDSSPLKNELL